MIPVIFPHDATEFTTQGWGTLSNCISCFVTEERNGIYELEAKVPMTSLRFDKIVEGNIIVATHSNKGDRQPFQIYAVSRPIDGVVTVRAEHISYRLNKNVVMPFTASGIKQALAEISGHTVDPCGFTFDTDKTSGGTFSPDIPKSVKSTLYGSDGSIIDTYTTGDYEFDLFAVHLWEDRGEDNGVMIRYGKNLTDIIQETDISDIYTAIVPYWTGTDEDGNEKIVMLSEYPQAAAVVSDYVDMFPTRRTVAVDLSDKFENMPTTAQLRSKAQSYVNDNVRRQLMTTIRASFIELSQTDQYKNLYEKEKVNLCDTVTCVYDALGISEKLKVTKIVYNVLADRNETITLGDLKRTLSSLLAGRSSSYYAKKTETIRAYKQLEGLPSINNVKLIGNINLSDLGITDGWDFEKYEITNIQTTYIGVYDENDKRGPFYIYRIGKLFYISFTYYIKVTTIPRTGQMYHTIFSGTYPDSMDKYVSNNANAFGNIIVQFTTNKFEFVTRAGVVDAEKNDRRIRVMVPFMDEGAATPDTLRINNIMDAGGLFYFSN